MLVRESPSSSTGDGAAPVHTCKKPRSHAGVGLERVSWWMAMRSSGS